MNETINGFLAWLGPILSALITSGGLAIINAKIAAGERKSDEARAETEAKRKTEAEWRERIERRIDEIEDKVDTTISAQCTQMRSDLIHRAHRYIDDLGCASIEEKQSLYAEWEEYQRLCDANDVTNHFVDQLVDKAMSLPDREL